MRKVISVSYQIDLKVFAGPPRKRFAELSKQELSQLVEQTLGEEREDNKQQRKT